MAYIQRPQDDIDPACDIAEAARRPGGAPRLASKQE